MTEKQQLIAKNHNKNNIILLKNYNQKKIKNSKSKKYCKKY